MTEDDDQEDTRPFGRRGASPEPELWAALEGGEKLMRILMDFYDRVYVDPRLVPFFDGVTKQRAIEKQYSFLRQMFTGEKVYFGDRPRNAHHWMVVSEELFDHREALMERVLAEHGLPPPMIARWRAVEERFRTHIVKAAPRPRRVQGKDFPLEGYEDLETPVGILCDGCGREVARGERVRSHVRTGKAYCAACADERAPSEKEGTWGR